MVRNPILLLFVPKVHVLAVRLGRSGLKISRIVLGCMSYGSPEWMPWILGEEEGIKQIKTAYDAGIQTFDTADVCFRSRLLHGMRVLDMASRRSTRTACRK